MEDIKVYYGTVIFFSNSLNYGFIEYEIDGVKQKDIFCHYSDIVSGGYKTLKKSQKVQFEIGLNKKGQPKAINVVAIKH